jgi:hypothetical protein
MPDKSTGICGKYQEPSLSFLTGSWIDLFFFTLFPLLCLQMPLVYTEADYGIQGRADRYFDDVGCPITSSL